MHILKAIWQFLVGVKDALALFFLLMLFFGMIALLRGGPAVSVPQGSALVLDLDGYLVDQATEQSPIAMLSGSADLIPEREVRDVIAAIDHAATDSRIKALVLQLDGFYGAGQANLQSVGEALRRFKASGKPVYAYSTAYLDDGYYLASLANEAWLNPLGAVLLTGPGGSNLYFAKALDKLAVDVEVFRVGTFKSAVEPFLRSEASPEAKAANQALVDSLWDTYVGDVQRARPKLKIDAVLADVPGRVRAAGGDFARAAVNDGFVDRIGSYADLGNRLHDVVGGGDDDTPGNFNQIALDDYLSAVHPLAQGSGASVGIVYVSGEIVDGEAPRGMAGGDTIADLVGEALADDDIKALVVRVDSPGGSVMASEKIRQALAAAKAHGVPIVASFGPVAASGGYWVATAADEIYAQPSTITGSIGVFAVLPTFNRALAELGVNADGVKSTPYSGEPDLFAGLTDNTRTLLQMSVEDIYRRFTGLVAGARKLSPARVNEIGQGRVWAGGTAQQLRLVDHFGGLDAAVAAAAKRAGLPDGRVRTVDIELKPSLPFQLLSQFLAPREQEQEQEAPDALGRMAKLSQLRSMAAIVDAVHVASGPTVQARCMACGARPAARAVDRDKLGAIAARLLAR